MNYGHISSRAIYPSFLIFLTSLYPVLYYFTTVLIDTIYLYYIYLRSLSGITIQNDLILSHFIL
jgi:hypothetical protein